MKQIILAGIELIGLGSLLGFAITMLWTFSIAYRNPNKEVLVTINSFGEANWEMILFVCLLPFMGWIVARAFLDICRRGLKE